MIIAVLLEDYVTDGVCVCVLKEEEGLPFYSSREEPYRGDLHSTRGRDLRPRVDVVSLKSFVGSCIAVLTV